MLAFGMLAGKRRSVGPKTFADAMDSNLAERWKAAMDNEMESIWKNDVWELVPPPKGCKIVVSRWVLGEKGEGFYKERYEMKDMGIARKFLGIQIEYGDDGSIKVHQEDYLRDILARHGMSDCNPIATPLDTSVKLTITTDSEPRASQTEYQTIVGELMFAAIATRPDIMCAVGQLSQFNSDPSSKHLLAAKRVLRYLKGTLTLGITYRKPPVKLTGLTDADWAGDVNTRRSTTGYVVMLNNGAIAWRSKRQVTVALSTTEAEYMAVTEAAKELKWM